MEEEVKERVKDLVKAMAYLNEFEIALQKMGFCWLDEKSNNSPLNICDIILNEIFYLLDLNPFDKKTDRILNELCLNDNTLETYENKFNIIWKEFGLKKDE